MAQRLVDPTFPDEPGVRATSGQCNRDQTGVTDLTIQDVPTTFE